MTSESMTAYCMKCKAKRPIQDAVAVFTAGGAPATRGGCAVCGTGLYLMGLTAAHDGLEKPAPAPKKKAGNNAGKRVGKKDAPPLKRKGKLVIVESPAKAKTIEHYLGKDYKVKASIGHVRDLLKSTLSVNVENNFEPTYSVPRDKKDVVKQLKAAAAQAEEIYLATDPDREGEAIAWHLMVAADIPPERAYRVEFFEITKDAIHEAFQSPRQIDTHRVDAQQARRVLDRLVGYELSPLLWQKVRPRLSAGRVQSVAVRVIVDREREIESFVPQEYWTIEAELARAADRALADRQAFMARLVKINGQDIELPTIGVVGPMVAELEQSEYVVDSIKRGQRKRKPYAPFTTSTLQQEASRRLNFTARKTMSVAQQLYEGVKIGAEGEVGLITYMRTDSTNISAQAQGEARNFIVKTYGANYYPSPPNFFGKKAKGAQEAHEAIRPTGVFRLPESIKHNLTKDQAALYRLIWQRFLASQMAAAVYDTLAIDTLAGLPSAAIKPYLFRSTGSTLRFPGFLAVYGDLPDEADSEEGLNRNFPELVDGDLLDLIQLLPEQHFTEPPPRYTEATLVKTLEENGIGRPSTYAPTISTIQDRGYVVREGKILLPTDIGAAVNDLLVAQFPDVVGLDFTAHMEEELDEIASGEREWRPVIEEFYTPFKAEVQHAFLHVPSVDLGVEDVGRACPTCGNPLIVRYGRFGKFIGCSTFPTCRYTEPWLEKIGVLCPLDGGEIIERKTKKGRAFYGCANYPACEWTSWKKPLPDPCPHCGGLLITVSRDTAKCASCGQSTPIHSLPSMAGAKQTAEA